jgi:hypothetical protein
MRKVIVDEFMSLDGVAQAPGAEDEDTHTKTATRPTTGSTTRSRSAADCYREATFPGI